MGHRSSRRGLVVALTLAAIVVACHATPNIQTPEGKTAYTADQIVLRVNALQAAAIEAERTGGLPTETTRQIVTTCVSMNETLRALPAGWATTVRTAWSELKFHLGQVTNPTVSAAMAIVDALLESWL